ncbi:MAG TPA: aspartate aminotransferase family protein [Kofleriaceae bacterium]|nr:aspartate aminotransferase family protein [Kofleriaceae bacterium]
MGIREVIRAAAAAPADEVRRRHGAHINPTFLEAIELVGFGRDFARGDGMLLHDARGRELLDFLAGYGATPLGHNHPDVRAAIEEVLAAGIPHFMLVSPQPMAAAVAERLARLAPGELPIAYLASSGSEAVEGAIKLARAVTRRPRLVAADGGYHGTTTGAVAVTGSAACRAPFGPLLDCAFVPWGRADHVERQLRRRDVAAVILEPIQAEGGVRLPPAGYLAEVAALCRRYGALLIIDEIQTGLGRTGAMFACETEKVEPDVLLVAKALSGGLAPISAYLTRRDLWKRAYGTLDRYDLHCTTFSGGPIGCAAALATLEVIERDRLVARAAEMGSYLGESLRAATAGHGLVREVRGRGQLWGIELGGVGGPPGDLIGQWLVVGLLERGVLTQVCGNASRVLRAEPPLIVERDHIDRFCRALQTALAEHARSAAGSLVGAAARALRSRVGALLGGERA